MRVIVAGSRRINDQECVYEFLDKLKSQIKFTEVVHGGARGPDLIGEKWAIENKIPVREFIAKWDRLGRSAGMIRNKEMSEYGDILVAFWDKKSVGTKNMIETAKDMGLMVIVAECETWDKGKKWKRERTYKI